MLTEDDVASIRGAFSYEDEFYNSFGMTNLPFVFSALSDAGRFRIFKILLHHSNLCVSDVARILGVSLSAASQQFKVLELCGIVRRTRKGKTICFELKKENPTVAAIMNIISANEKRENLQI